SVPRLARPGAPVATRAHEVAVGRLSLLERGHAVAEEPALTRPHLEAHEAMAVLGLHAVAGLAAGDPESLAAVGAEHVADRLLGRALERREPPLAVGLRLVHSRCGA